MAERAMGQAAGAPPDPPRPSGRPPANVPNSRRALGTLLRMGHSQEEQ